MAVACALAALLMPGRPAGAQNVATLSLEDLLDARITSASRYEQRVMDTAAAVFVITQEDIRRSGLTSVPELLRIAPGVQVAHINATTWAIAIRGFNQQWSDKLLVLIDGRAIYDGIFSGVYWDAVDMLPEDIERIEVVRGPGGAVWGANAVSGVINILTKASSASKGLLVRADAGTQGAGSFAARYGTSLGGASFRGYAERRAQGHAVDQDGAAAFDGARNLVTGMRLDWSDDRDDVMLTADAARVDNDLEIVLPGVPITPGQLIPHAIGKKRNESALARWTHRWSETSSLQLQGFGAHSTVATTFNVRVLTLDLDATWHVRRGRHDLMAGGGFRHVMDDNRGNESITMSPDRESRHVASTFLQDAVSLAGDRLTLTLGSKFEHHTWSGWAVQPTARLIAAPTPSDRAWVAASRALRMPSRLDRDLAVENPPVAGPDGLSLIFALVGNKNFQPEELRSIEAGYRREWARGSVDVAAFASWFDQLKAVYLSEEFIPGPPPTLKVLRHFENGARATSNGLEVTAQQSLSSRWTVTGSYTFLQVADEPFPGNNDPDSHAYLQGTPRHLAQVRSRWTFGHVEADAAVAFTGPLTARGIDAFTRGDVRLAWRGARGLSVALSAQNLFAGPHQEFAGPEVVIPTYREPQRVGLQVSWEF